jgi:hypothetical protein
MEAAVYRLGGLRIRSDFPLFGAQFNEAGARCDVVIRRGHISQAVASATAKIVDGRYIGEYNGKEILIDLPAVGRFLLRAGKEILMDLPPYADQDEVRAYLLGFVFGALCHQRGIIPLHASAIDVADGCVAFVGASGAGTSTLVASLAQRGHPVIADDVCFLQLSASGDVRAWPGFNRIRLWEDTRAVLGFAGSGVEREMRRYNKYFIPVAPPRNPTQSRPLRRIYQLHPGADSTPKMTRLLGAEVLEVLMQNVYPPGLAECLGYKPRVFLDCAAMARMVSVFRFSRPRAFAALGRATKMLENHLSR